MPEIKYHHSCAMSVGTDQWVATLTVNQMRCAHDQMAEKTKAADESPNARFGGCAAGVFARSITAKMIMKKQRTTFFEFTKSGSYPKPRTGWRSQEAT